MTATFTVETVPGDRVPATGTLPALRTIVLRRHGPELAPLPTPVRRVVAPDRPTIPATVAAMVAHFRTGPVPKRQARVPVGATPPPTGEALKALRKQVGVSQREAALGAGVSRGLVSEMECPREGRRTLLLSLSSESGTYLTWLWQQVALLGATSGATSGAQP